MGCGHWSRDAVDTCGHQYSLSVGTRYSCHILPRLGPERRTRNGLDIDQRTVPVHEHKLDHFVPFVGLGQSAGKDSRAG